MLRGKGLFLAGVAGLAMAFSLPAIAGGFSPHVKGEESLLYALSNHKFCAYMIIGDEAREPLLFPVILLPLNDRLVGEANRFVCKGES